MPYDPTDLDRPTLSFGDDEREFGERALEDRYDVRTVCNVIRRIHLTANNPEVSLLCAEAIYMAKSMARRLKHYKKDWHRGLWLPETKPLDE